MKILVVGATGMVGSEIANELVKRGHETTRVSRSGGDGVVQADVSDLKQFTDIAAGHDVVVSAISPPRDGSDTIEPTLQLAQTLIAGIVEAKVKRLIVVGGAGSLLLPDGSKLLDSPAFPPEYKPEATAHSMFLDKLKSDANEVDWTYISPAAIIAPGEKTGNFTVGGDDFMVDEAGESRISVEDYALMLVGELENPTVSKQRLSVAYT